MGELDDALRAEREQEQRQAQEHAAAQRRGAALIAEFVEAMKDRPSDTITKIVVVTERVKTGLFRSEEQRTEKKVNAHADGWVLQERLPADKDGHNAKPEVAVTRSGRILIDGKPGDVYFDDWLGELHVYWGKGLNEHEDFKTLLLRRLKRRP